MTRRNLFVHILSAAAAPALLGAVSAGCRADAQSAPATTAPATKQAQAKPPAASREKIMFFVGTYAKPDDPGIYAFQLDPGNGRLAPIGTTSGVGNPSFLAVHPGGQYLYAASEAGGGAVCAFKIDRATGALTLLNQESAKGGGTCYVSVTPDGRYALAANYGSGSIAALPIGNDGKLAPATGSVQHEGPSRVNERRQEKPHAHSINPDPTGRYAVAADLGLDKLLIYRLDGETPLLPADPPYTASAPGAGPRHTAFHPNGRFLFAINELDNTLVVYAWNAEKGTLSPRQSVKTLPDGFQGSNTTAEVAVHPSGRFVYGSNRGHDSIAIFRFDQDNGMITPAGHESSGGKQPRHFAIDPSGRFLIAANQETGNLVVYAIDADTGKLTPTGATANVPKAVCVRFVR